MIISISPPNYFPACDLLHRIILSDVHVILDTIPFEENNLINRCKIQTSVGWQWLNVPVLSKSSNDENIMDLSIFKGKPWEKKHLDTLIVSYKKAPFFKKHLPFIENLFSKKWEKIIDIDLFIYDYIINQLEIKTKIIKSSTLIKSGKDRDQIIDILDEFVADVYFAEAFQKDYFENEKYKEIFEQMRAKIIYQKYKPAVYKQLYTPFVPLLGFIDLMLNLEPKDIKKIIFKDNIKKIRAL